MKSVLQKIQNYLQTLSRRTYTYLASIGGGILIILIVLICYRSFIAAPVPFPDPGIVVIPNGTSLSSMAKVLKQEHFIRSPFWFTNFVMFFKHERQAVGGEYYFEKPLNAFEVAKRVSRGYYNTEQLKTTIPEGSTVSDISLIIKKHYPLFDSVHFVTIAQGKEGFLFPDTYNFGPNVDPESVVTIMTNTFNKKMSEPEVSQAIESFGKPLRDDIIMASILEGEARQTETRQIVAGILWKRIKMGIPLQVDTTFRYVNGKTSSELTAQDLKIDSPYNTYIHQGLPPTPISNPGLDSIMAAVTPTDTDYLYFLTDSNGVMHYAKTLAEHVQNKKKYLGK